jgi:hypothetical protein
VIFELCIAHPELSNVVGEGNSFDDLFVEIALRFRITRQTCTRVI